MSFVLDFFSLCFFFSSFFRSSRKKKKKKKKRKTQKPALIRKTPAPKKQPTDFQTSHAGWAGAAVPALRSQGKLRGLGAAGGCTACVVSIEDAGPLKTQTRDLNDGVATLNNLASMYRTYYLSSLERRNG